MTDIYYCKETPLDSITVALKPPSFEHQSRSIVCAYDDNLNLTHSSAKTCCQYKESDSRTTHDQNNSHSGNSMIRRSEKAINFGISLHFDSYFFTIEFTFENRLFSAKFHRRYAREKMRKQKRNLMLKCSTVLSM